jgi:hypothetical protein
MRSEGSRSPEAVAREIHRKSRRKFSPEEKFRIVPGVIAAGLCIGFLLLGNHLGPLLWGDKTRDYDATPPSFVGDSRELAATTVVADLNTSWPEGKNAIWCASIVGAWKTLSDEVFHEPIVLEGAEALCERLASADDPGSFLDPNDYYSAAGWVKDGIIGRIQRELRKRFPDREVPTFPGITANSLLAYAYMTVQIRFDQPYLQSQKPLAFVAADGETTLVRAFGLPRGQTTGPPELRGQAEVLYRSRTIQPDGRPGDLTYAVDLCRTSRPYQIIVARVHRGETLAEMVSDLDIEIGPKRETGHGHQGLLSETELLVPESCWRIVHYFSELENRPFLNSGIDAPTLNVVRQDTEFRLDRSGVQLKSEATVYTIGLASDYIFDGPFLILIRDRDSRRPLFVMWVETAELLEPWEGQGADE